MKKEIFIVALLVAGITVHAQQWSGASNGDGIIYRNGSIGIGTPYPLTDLYIVGNTGIGIHRSGFGVLQIYPEQLADSRKGFMFTNFETTPKYIAFRNKNAGDPNLFIQENGNIGIGTITPTEKLEVNGKIKSKGLKIPADSKITFGEENSNTGSLSIFNASCCYNTYADIKGNLYFRTEASQATLSIQKDATVLIGVWPDYADQVVNTDGAKLMVNGKILCEEVKVIQDVPNSDHVFGKEYKLRSLKEIEGFVIEHHHLPEVPSAEEFKTNGYCVGEMDDLLLRKVEELTLYIIQQQKEIDELKNQLNEK